jgi:5'-methylthioadenosine phosphorylase
VGSLKEKYEPLHMVVPDQFVDRTYRRESTFFGRGLVAHVAFAEPFCGELRGVMAAACREAGATVHEGGTYVCIEGPHFSTKAESELYRSWGMDIIGMTNLQEAKLAREAEICYAAIALATDYDCWRKRPADEDKVALLEEIISNVKAATQNAIALLGHALPHVAANAERPCDCQSALRLAIWSDRQKIPADVRQRLAPITARYIG